MSEEQTTTRWMEIKNVFIAASALDTAERDAYLAATCTSASVREEVQALLAAHDAPGPLDRLMDDVMTPLQQQQMKEGIAEGQQIGPYRVIGELGRGGMGRVYRARDDRLQRDVALKVLAPSLDTNEAAKERLLQEARAASALDHPNICTIYDVGTTEAGQWYIAMACYEGETLAEKMEAGPLPIGEAFDLARQMAEGLACAHEAGITHRDIKPSNVLVTAKGTAKILDFGIAKLTPPDARTRAQDRVGTAAYMAPEQVRGEPVDARADLWALGIVLYEMIAGVHPFRSAFGAALFYAILEKEPGPVMVRRPEAPSAIDRILKRLLAKAPEARYSHAGELLAALGQPQVQPVQPVVLRLRPLPERLTSFVGRTHELDRVERLLARARLVTLTGPAGTGKTRLALEAAARMQDDFAEGVGFVSLASVSDPGLVASTLAQSLGVATAAAASPLEHLKRTLAGCELLLVIDNFEQVVAAAPVLAELLVECSALRMLVTSRVALRISGEHEFPVPPLDLVGAGAPDWMAARMPAAIQLFAERARAAHPNFALTEANVAAVAELCRRLDGLPLAIELAAARIKLFSPQAMLARLEHRFELLKGGPRDLPVRHQTLREAIAWSYDLLSTAHRALLMQLSVFVGGCTLSAIEAVCSLSTGDLIDGMAALVDHSLVRQEEDTRGEPRFFMLETIRAFGIERLRTTGTLDAVRQRHATYFRDFAEQAAPELTGAAQTRWFDRLACEHDNLRAALRWATVHHVPEFGVRLGAALWRFWVARGYLLEGRQWLNRLRTMPIDDALVPAHTRVLHGLGTIAHNQGDNEDARALLDESLQRWRTLGDEQGMARALNNLAWVACETSAFDRADALAREAEALCRRIDDRRGVAVALNNQGWVANYRGLYRAAVAFHRKSLDLRRALGDQRGIAFALANLAWAETYHGGYERATALLDEAFVLAQAVKDGQLCIWIDVLRAHAARDEGEAEKAAALLEKVLLWWTEGSNRSIRAWTLNALAAVHIDGGRSGRADPLLRESRPLWEAIGCTWGKAGVAYEEGRIARIRGDHARARDRYAASWRLRVRLQDQRGMAECLEALALLLAEDDTASHAVRLLAVAHTIRAEIEAPFPAHRRPEQERRLVTLRREVGTETFERLWHEGAGLGPDKAVAHALPYASQPDQNL